MKKSLAFAMALSIISLFAASGLIGVQTLDTEFSDISGASTALANMTDDITTLLTDIIPVFIILGVFGAVIAYVGKLSKGFGGN